MATKEEKELLLKDLCGRLPYHIKVAINYKIYLNVLPDENFKERFLFLLKYDKKTIEEKSLEPHIICSYPCRNRFMTFTGCHDEYGVPIEAIKPYLRPMSSMTEDECKYCVEHFGIQSTLLIGAQKGMIMPMEASSMFIDWLNAHHFDYRGLIEKGLALEAPEGMCK